MKRYTEIYLSSDGASQVIEINTISDGGPAIDSPWLMQLYRLYDTTLHGYTDEDSWDSCICSQDDVAQLKYR